MTLGMEFHDAQLLGLDCGSDGSGYLLLHAYIYRSEGIVFEDPQESGWQNCRFSFKGMRIEGPRVEPNEYVSGGAMRVDGTVHDHVILLPASFRGRIQLDLVISPLFETLRIHATEISSTLEGPWELERIWAPDEMGQ
jgi:hypothetical protein